MLAAHLRRLERPVRYAAMDPAHVRALENYLRISSRASGIPSLHREAQPVLASLYGAHPPIAQHFQGLMQGDHTALAQYLDLLNEHGDLRDTPSGINHPNAALSDLIHRLALHHRNIASGDDRGRSLYTMYSQAALEDPSTRGVLNPEYGTSRTPGVASPAMLAAQLQHELGLNGLANHPLAHLLHQSRNTMDTMTGNLPQALAGMHDVAHGLDQEPQVRHIRKNLLRPLETRSGSILRNILIPHLAENFG